MKLLDLDLYTTDLTATRHFYVRRLGLPVLSRSYDHLTLMIGWTRLTFHLTSRPVAPYHLAINVPRSSLDVVMYYFDLDYLDTDRPDNIIADLPDWRAKACYFYDGTGNLLEFIASTDLPLDDPNLTINDLFQGVSEIGIGTEDVASTACQLQRRFGVTPFSRSAPTADFTALGDDNGLFILSKVGRNWLFTNTPAGLNYCRVRFVNEPGGMVHEMTSYELNQLPIGKVVSAL